MWDYLATSIHPAKSTVPDPKYASKNSFSMNECMCEGENGDILVRELENTSLLKGKGSGTGLEMIRCEPLKEEMKQTW